MARKHRVWRFQRGTMSGSNIVSAMTHDRTLVMHFAIDPVWLLNFNERFTFYAVAMVVGTTAEPRLRILREVTEGEWK